MTNGNNNNLMLPNNSMGYINMMTSSIKYYSLKTGC